MNRKLGLSLLAGLASGVLFVAVLSSGGLGVVLIYLTPLPLMVAGLCFGLGHVAVGSLAGLVAVGAASLGAAGVFAVLAVLPSLVVVRQALLWRTRTDGALEWYPAGRVLAWLVAVALVLLVGGAVVLALRGNGVEASIKGHVAVFAGEVLTQAPAELKEAMTNMWTSVLPAAATGAWIMVAAVNAALAQWLATKARRALRPTPVYRDLAVPDWLAIALGVALLAALATSGDGAYVAQNAAAALLVPQFLVGLGVVHRFFRPRPYAGLWLTAFYVLGMVLFGWAVIAVAGLGLMKDWRRRSHGRGQEEE